MAVAQRLVTRNGWRNTTLAQIAKEAGVSAAGLLHHFESKEQLLHAVVDARDADDDAHADRSGDRLLARQQAAVRIVTDLIRRGQESGRYRNDFDPAVKAVQIVSLVNGMEISWLLDPSIPLQQSLQEYARSLAREFAPDPS